MSCYGSMIILGALLVAVAAAAAFFGPNFFSNTENISFNIHKLHSLSKKFGLTEWKSLTFIVKNYKTKKQAQKPITNTNYNYTIRVNISPPK